MADLASHNDNITVNISTDATPTQVTGLGNILLIVPIATNAITDGTLLHEDGVPGNDVGYYKSYTSAAEANADSNLADATKLAVTACFAQRPSPAKMWVCAIDLVGGGSYDGPYTYAQGLAHFKAVNEDWFIVTTDVKPTTSGNATIIEAVAAAVAAMSPVKLYFVQAANESTYADVFDGGWDAVDSIGVTTSVSGTRTAVIYHDTAAQWADVAWAASRIAFDPEVRSVDWTGSVRGITSYASRLSSTQKNALDTNYINNGLTYGGATFYVDAGVLNDGTPIYETVTQAWFESNLIREVAALKVNADARGEKIPLTTKGAGLVLSILRGLYQRGIAAGHFVEDEDTVIELTSLNTSTRTMTFRVVIRYAVSGRLFTFNVNFTRSAISA